VPAAALHLSALTLTQQRSFQDSGLVPAR